eukprot:4957875-Karenia_brevis.AAC.1
MKAYFLCTDRSSDQYEANTNSNLSTVNSGTESGNTHLGEKHNRYVYTVSPMADYDKEDMRPRPLRPMPYDRRQS